MYKYVKRIIDMVGAIIFMIICLIPFSVISLVLYITQKKVFFIQERVGQNEKIFLIYKFQTMSSKTNNQGELLSDEERLTKIGIFLRRLSLDELPQILNILKGDMSFIGPRPLLSSYLPLYNNEERRRHEVKPGLTGLAQVKGRNNISWKAKFKWDIIYVQKMSFYQDVYIFFQTIKKVLTRADVTLEGHATTQPFRGH